MKTLKDIRLSRVIVEKDGKEIIRGTLQEDWDNSLWVKPVKKGKSYPIKQAQVKSIYKSFVADYTIELA